MPVSLTKQLFAPTDWDEVQSFDCGDAPYEIEVAAWLKGKGEPDVDSALTSIQHPTRPSKVWLYRLATGELVGFGALGKSEWRWKGKKDPKVPLTVIVWVGIQKAFQGQPPPPAPKTERYAVQILDDLIAESLEEHETHPVLGLFVHRDNIKAIKLYEWAGFSADFEHPVNKVTGQVEYLKMALVLDAEALAKIVTPKN